MQRRRRPVPSQSSSSPLADTVPELQGDLAGNAVAADQLREVPYRSQLESAFGESFQGVLALCGASLGGLGANAATDGEVVVFAEERPSLETVAHELAHVVQGRRSGGGGTGVSSPGDDAEVEARSVAAAAARGERVDVQAA